MKLTLPHSDLRAVVPCPQTRLVEYGSAAVALWWTYLLLLPVHLFQTNPAFTDLAHVATEWKWGVASLGIGLWQIRAARRGHPLARWFGCVLSAGLWSGICSCLVLGSRWQYGVPINTGCGNYGVAIVLALICAVFLAPYALADVLIWAGRLRRTLAARYRKFRPKAECPEE